MSIIFMEKVDFMLFCEKLESSFSMKPVTHIHESLTNY